MVTLGLSTITVVTSIVSMRLSGVSRPMPGWLRHSALRTVAGLMCVRLSSRSKSTVAPSDRDGCGSTSKLIASSDIISLDAGNNASNDSRRSIDHKIDDVLCELRKVGCLR